ncbi:MAG: DUF6597 domain-containing transcriptional factor [Cyanobacteria bacterium P01_H01_bin.15]
MGIWHYDTGMGSCDYLCVPPCTSLAHVVSEIWCQYADSSPAAKGVITRVLPSGVAEITFSFGDPFLEVTDRSETPLHWASINGQKTTLKRYRATGATGLVIVRLFPWGLGALRLPPAAAFSNLNVDAEAVWPAIALNHLQDRLCGARSISEQVDAVQAFLREAIANTHPRGIRWLYMPSVSFSGPEILVEFRMGLG